MKLNYCVFFLSLISTVGVTQEAPKYKQLMAMNLGEMMQVKVATGTAKELSEAPAVVSVITAEDIKVSGARTLAEAVERVPGLHVMSSEFRMQNLFAIRGIQSTATPQVLVLLDGTQINEAAQWSTPIGFNFPVNNIERIEIIRGPGSAIYGADAFSGVINIITKKVKGDNSFVTGAKLGSFDYRELWLNADFAINDLLVGLSITKESMGNDSDRVTPYGVLERNRDSDNVHLKLGYQSFSMNSWYYKVQQKMGVGANLVGNDIDLDTSEVFKTKLEWSGELGNSIEATASATYFSHKINAYFQLLPPGTWPIGADGNLFGPPFTSVLFPEGVIGHPQGDTEKLKFDSSMVYTGIKNHRLRLGFGGKQEELKNIREVKNFGPGVLDEDNMPDDLTAPPVVDVTGTDYIYSPAYDRDLWFISLQDEWKFATNWELTAGIRYDHYSDFGSTTNPRLALVWNTSDIFTSKLLYGTAFRAPKVAELAYQNNPASVGNPNVKPEEIDTVELVFDYRASEHLHTMLNLFKYKATGLIQLDTAFVHQNIGEQEGQGAELEVNWQLTDKLKMSANMSYLDSQLPLIDEDKAQVPGIMGYLDLRYQVNENWWFSTQAYYIADRKRQLADTRPEVSDFTKVNATVTWQPKGIWQAKIGIQNLLDENIVEPTSNSGLYAIGLGFPDDHPMQSRQLYGEVSASF